MTKKKTQRKRGLQLLQQRIDILEEYQERLLVGERQQRQALQESYERNFREEWGRSLQERQRKWEQKGH